MKQLLHSRSFYITTAAVVIATTATMAFFVQNNQPEPLITTTVEKGFVRQLVSVSGIAEAEQKAELTFPQSGVVREVRVKTGTEVATGDVLVTLESNALYADRQAALAAIQSAEATRDELVAGPTGTSRDITQSVLDQAKEQLETTIENENQKVANAYRALLSTDLTAYTSDPGETAVAPIISGTYGCEAEGMYTLDVFSSGGASGYSYKLSGLESGTFPASVDQPTTLGNCGLRALFDSNSTYGRTSWVIEVPNKKSPLYITNRNAYSLAVTQAESAITSATQNVLVAEATATNNNAPARNESLQRANAAVTQAYASLARIDTQLSDRILTAPFAGTITEIDILPGETVTATPVLTLLAKSEFEITARIPEIDIGKLLVGQPVEMVFDARSTETISGEISFISLQATEIDGVAYYEAIIKPESIPPWMRSGLNADIDIIISDSENELRIPKRFLSKTATGYEVLRRENGLTASTTVELILEGNDGYVAISGLNEGDILVAP